jgi:hypothetical protein
VSGCADKEPQPTTNTISTITNKGVFLSYALIQNGKFIKLLKSRNAIDYKKYDVIRITDKGFSPIFNTSSITCQYSLMLSTDKKNYGKCNSSFYTTTVGDGVQNAIVNVLGTVASLGTNIVTGSASVKKSFNKEVFLTAVNENDLVSIQKELILKRQKEIALQKKLEEEKQQRIALQRKKLEEEKQQRIALQRMQEQEKREQERRIALISQRPHDAKCQKILQEIDNSSGLQQISLYKKLDTLNCQ